MRDDAAATDEELLRRARGGDAAALGTLLSRHRDVAFRVAVGILEDDDDAADAVQDAFMRAVGALDGFRGDARFRTWLLSVVVNQARSALRRSARRRETPLEAVPESSSDEPHAGETVAVRQRARRARALLATLPEKQRLAVQLRVDEGLSFREVGAVIGSSEGAARVNYHHAMKRLRRQMEEEER